MTVFFILSLKLCFLGNNVCDISDSYDNLLFALLPTTPGHSGNNITGVIDSSMEDVVVLTIVFSCVRLIYNFRIGRNVFGKSSMLLHLMDNSALDVRPAFLLIITLPWPDCGQSVASFIQPN